MTQPIRRLTFMDAMQSFDDLPPLSLQAIPVQKDALQEISLFLQNAQGQLLHELSDAEKRSLEAGTAAFETECRLGLIIADDCHTTEECRIRPFSGPGVTAYSSQDLQMRGYRFVSGVSFADFRSVQRTAHAIVDCAVEGGCASEDTVFTYSGGRRVVVSNSGGPACHQHKSVKLSTTFHSPSTLYDFRLCVSLESRLPMPEGAVPPPPDWTCRRTRQRHSYTAEEWHLDTTSVLTTVSSDQSSQLTMEVELELKLDPQKQWLKSRKRSHSDYLARCLAGLLSRLLPATASNNTVSTDDALRQEDSLEVCRQVSSLCRLLSPSSTGATFPGAMPVNMCRKHMSEVQSREYYVTEKTNGERYLLVSVEGAAVLVDRRMQTWKLHDGAVLSGALGAGTVLDGELVHTTQGPVYMIFDLLAVKGVPLLQEVFSNRFQIVSDSVMSALSSVADQLHHVRVKQKRFFARTQLSHLLQCIRKVPGMTHDRVYVESATQTQHKTDGIILQPNTPYCTGTDLSLLKWKWTDIASVDVRACYQRGVLCLTSGEISLTGFMQFGRHDRARLVSDLLAMPQGSSIVEAALDCESGLWLYLGLRRDKDKANYITTIMSTLVEVAEGVCEQELEYRVGAASPREDDWTKQLTKMKSKLMVWNRAKPTS